MPLRRFFIDQHEIADTKNQSFRNIMIQISPEGVQNQTLEILKRVIEMIETSREKTLSKPVFDSIQFIEKIIQIQIFHFSILLMISISVRLI